MGQTAKDFFREGFSDESFNLTLAQCHEPYTV
jgi:hypothetical protein